LLALYEPGNEAAWLASFRFEVEVLPRYCETDALGHVSNTVYPEYLEFGRLQYLIAAGDPERGPFAFAHVTAELNLRYMAACFYNEPLWIASKLVALGRSSASMEQAMLGADRSIRAIARVAMVCSDGQTTAPWTAAQRAALEAFEGRALTG
jgi:acyl-CoA thioester hydrolase